MERFVTSTMLALVASTLIAPAVAWAEAGTIEGTVAHARGNANLVVYIVSAPGNFRRPRRTPK